MRQPLQGTALARFGYLLDGAPQYDAIYATTSLFARLAVYAPPA